MTQAFSEWLKRPVAPIANPQAIFTHDDFRITLLTSRLIRIEYSPNGQFQDRPSQAFWYRDQPVPDFSAGGEGALYTVQTDHLLVTLDSTKEGIHSISVTLKATGVTWQYGDVPTGNLRGTARTLDGVDGATPLELGLLSRDGWAVVDDSRSLVFNDAGWLMVRPDVATTYDLYFFGHADDYQGALDDFFRIAGGVPMIPRWALGNWWSRYWAYSDMELLALMDEFTHHNVPLSVCIIDMDWHITDTSAYVTSWNSGWTGYTWEKSLFPDPPAFLAQLHRRGLRTALNLHPHDGVQSHEEAYEAMAKYMGRKADGEPIKFDIADPRYTEAYFALLHHPHETIGVDFWWLDWQQGEKTSLDGLDPLWWLNHLHFYDLGRDDTKRPFIFSRWGGLGNHRYPIGFSGDTHTTWASLSFQPYMTATASNVGYSWWSHDIGGHMFGIEDGELYTRWVQFGIFSPIMRLHSTKNHYSERRPWGWRSAEVEKVAGDAMRLRHTLIPYLYSMAWRNAQEGVALVRPMYYTHPKHDSAYHAPGQYWFGSEMIVAPHTAPIHPETGMSRNAVWLPEGDWYDFASGTHYTGGGWMATYGDLRHIPIFVRDGGIIPLADPATPNDAPNPQTLHVQHYGAKEGQFMLYEDDGASMAYLKGEHSITTLAISAEGDLRVSGDAPRPHIPPDRAYIVHYHNKDRDIRAECEAMLWRFQMNTWAKDALGLRLNDFITDPLVLRDFATYLTEVQIRALLETAHGVGVHRLAPEMGMDETFILWNKHNHPDFRYSFTKVLEKQDPWPGNAISEGGIVPTEKIIHPPKPRKGEHLLFTHYQLRVDYFGMVTVIF